MAVHDDTAVILGGCEKWFANPYEIVVGLLGQRYSRSDSGMHEKIIADNMADFQAAQKGEVRFRQDIAKFLLKGNQPVRVGFQGRSRNAVADQRIRAAII